MTVKLDSEKISLYFSKGNLYQRPNKSEVLHRSVVQREKKNWLSHEVQTRSKK